MKDNLFEFSETVGIKNFGDARGSLSVLQQEDLPFLPKRFFWITNVPQGVSRGNHGHFQSQQYLCCVSGEVQLQICAPHQSDPIEIILKENSAIFLPALHWVSMKFQSTGAILLVLADQNYDEKDVFTEPIK